MRLLIEKTYKDPKSYFAEGDAIVFTRSLSIRRNGSRAARGLRARVLQRAVADPLGAGRPHLGQLHERRPDEAPLVIKARRLPP